MACISRASGVEASLRGPSLGAKERLSDEIRPETRALHDEDRCQHHGGAASQTSPRRRGCPADLPAAIRNCIGQRGLRPVRGLSGVQIDDDAEIGDGVRVPLRAQGCVGSGRQARSAAVGGRGQVAEPPATPARWSSGGQVRRVGTVVPRIHKAVGGRGLPGSKSHCGVRCRGAGDYYGFGNSRPP